MYMYMYICTLVCMHTHTHSHMRAAVMRQFHHPHIIRLFGVVQEQAILIVMELAPLGQVSKVSLSLSLSLSLLLPPPLSLSFFCIMHALNKSLNLSLPYLLLC